MSKWLLYLSCLPLLFYFWQYGEWQPLHFLLKRLRWLFISLFILHLWFHGADLNWIPSLAGLYVAIEKIFVLILMVFTAHILLISTSIPNLISAIQWWFKPLNRLGFNSEVLAVRLALTLETLNHVHALYQQQPVTHAQNPLAAISQRATLLFQAVATHSEQTPLSKIEVLQLPMPPIWQWLYPLGLIVMMVIS